jgi:hypothetical protein
VAAGQWQQHRESGGGAATAMAVQRQRQRCSSRAAAAGSMQQGSNDSAAAAAAAAWRQRRRPAWQLGSLAAARWQRGISAASLMAAQRQKARQQCSGSSGGSGGLLAVRWRQWQRAAHQRRNAGGHGYGSRCHCPAATAHCCGGDEDTGSDCVTTRKWIS